MPLFEFSGGELVPFQRLKGGAGLYEKEIEDHLWRDLETMTGDTFFPVARQPKLPFGGIPDIVALEKSGRVVVFEIKRDVDRNQITQCLEYAGWARTTNLEELANLYHLGSDAFWAAWMEFTESSVPVPVAPNPRLVLVARDFQERTQSAFEFLTQNGVPITLFRVTLYEDHDGRRFIDVEGDREIDLPGQHTSESAKAADYKKIFGRAIKVADLVEHNVLAPGDELRWSRPMKGETYHATITDDGHIRLPDGREFWSPSGAACAAADIPAIDGWHSWVVVRLDAVLDDLRKKLHAQVLTQGSGNEG